jgi:hypothetical protein
MTKRLTRNQLYFSENALKLTYGNVPFQKFFGGYIPRPLFRGREKRRKRGEVLGGNTGSGAVGEETREGMEEDREGNGRGKWKGVEGRGRKRTPSHGPAHPQF